MRAALLFLCILLSVAYAQLDVGSVSASLLSEWRQLITNDPGGSDLEKLGRVNSFFNQRLHFDDDTRIWGEQDYWATPTETLQRGSGDCEDFVIAKYFTLLRLNISPDKLRLIYVRAHIGGIQSGYSQAHMVLGYYADGTDEPMILDNLIGEIRPASRRPDLSPVFSFNSKGLWTRGQKPVADPTTRLSRWRNLLLRLSNEEYATTPGPAPTEETDHVTQ